MPSKTVTKTESTIKEILNEIWSKYEPQIQYKQDRAIDLYIKYDLKSIIFYRYLRTRLTELLGGIIINS
jgi:ppGpp synthetase/RelA/SpoT-type nucleotidyltranferase